MMKVALAILCIGAVIFLLRVLAALVKEWLSYPPGAIRVHVARFEAVRRPGELIEMNPEAFRRKAPARTGQRMAL
jgi:hypothetical protein